MRDRQWEYKLIVLKHEGFGLNMEKTISKYQQELNQLGKLGWELVALKDSGLGYPVAYMKR